MTTADGQPTLEVEKLLSCQGDVMGILTGTGLPPGSRVTLALDHIIGAPLRLNGKITRIDRHDGNLFSIVVRLHSVTREQREIINTLDP